MSAAPEHLEPNVGVNWQGSSSLVYPDVGANSPVRLIHVNNRIPPPNIPQFEPSVVDVYAEIGYLTAAARPHYIPYNQMDLRRSSSDTRMTLIDIAINTAPSKQDDNMVPINIVVKVAGSIVGIVCLASLIISNISGFDMINPLIALLMLIASASFLIMTKVNPARDIP
jgi:hypothetical protein